jgi:AcrR family transcriptional regulator
MVDYDTDTISPNRRDAILHAAAEMFMDRGYAATSISDIAERLSSTKGRVYYYYHSKAELFFDIHIAAIRSITRQVTIAAAAEVEPVSKLRAMVHAHAKTIMEEFAFQKVSTQSLNRHIIARGELAQDRIGRRVIKLRDDYEELFVDAIAAGVKSREFRQDVDPRLATKAALGALNWITVWYQPRKSRPKYILAIADQMADFVVKGLRAL